MDGIRSILRPIQFGALVFAALAGFLVLILVAAAWYYLRSLSYLVGQAIHLLRPVPKPSTTAPPHFVELPAKAPREYS